MAGLFHYVVLFVAKVCDNALGTAKTIFIQRSRWLLTGLAVTVSDLIYLSVMKNIVTDGNKISIIIVAVAGGIGCALACLVTDKISKDRTYVNVIMSDNRDVMNNCFGHKSFAWRSAPIFRKLSTIGTMFVGCESSASSQNDDNINTNTTAAIATETTETEPT